MANGVRIEKLTRQGIAMMQEERELALKGDISALEKLNQRKIEFLSKMEALATSKKGPRIKPEQKAELETLFEIMRRRAEENQVLLRAAAAGVAEAKRQIENINSPNSELGVYGRDGAPVKNNSDLTSNSHIF